MIKFSIEYPKYITYEGEKFEFCKFYERNLDGFKQAVKDLKSYKAEQTKKMVGLEEKLKLAEYELIITDCIINELGKELALTEKALELACERVKYFEEMQDKEMGFYDFFGYESDYDLQAIIEQYKEQAKEMMKSE